MKKALLILLLVMPVLFLAAQNNKKQPEQKVQKKEIPASDLPKKITLYISSNLPNARITKVTKQKRIPDEKFVVAVNIKTKHHILVFNKKGNLVKLDGKKVYTSAAVN